MEVCTSSGPLQSMGQDFVNPLLNTVWIFVVYFTLLKRWRCIGYLVDIGAAGWLLYGTMIWKLILTQTHWMTDVCAALHANEHTVYQFLAISLVCWVASCILECRSLRFLCKIQLSNIPRQSKVLYFIALLTSANSCLVMLNYSSRVHKSFKLISQDEWVLMYFLLAALSKNIRVFFQGLVFASRVSEPWVFVRENDTSRRKVMTRMALSNGVMLVQSVILLFWTWQWRIMTLMASVCTSTQKIVYLYLLVFSLLTSCMYLHLLLDYHV